MKFPARCYGNPFLDAAAASSGVELRFPGVQGDADQTPQPLGGLEGLSVAGQPLVSPFPNSAEVRSSTGFVSHP